VAEGWSERERTQFTRIKQGLQRAGMAEHEADANARRTIEQARIRPRKPPPDPANPTKDQLYREAMRYDIAGRSKMDKEQLLSAVRAVRGE
jgi:hypothetical protein